ncbi:hypothetical protein ACVWYH_002580 [Bradyrhizobium sp. GM24.11]
MKRYSMPAWAAERRRRHRALQMGVEPAGKAGEHGGVDEHQELGARRVHTERLGCDMAAP